MSLYFIFIIYKFGIWRTVYFGLLLVRCCTITNMQIWEVNMADRNTNMKELLTKEQKWSIHLSAEGWQSDLTIRHDIQTYKRMKNSQRFSILWFITIIIKCNVILCVKFHLFFFKYHSKTFNGKKSMHFRWFTLL